jgi:hypothetical protein
MERHLKVIQIHNTSFYVDLPLMELRQVDNVLNAISFEDIRGYDDHCLIVYDKTTKNAFRGELADAATNPNVVLFRLPALKDLDPEQMDKHLGISDSRQAIENAAEKLQLINRARKVFVNADRAKRKKM